MLDVGKLNAFLDVLKRERFSVGVRERLRMYEFVAALAGQGVTPATTGRERSMLGSLLAKSPAELQRFNILFRAHFDGVPVIPDPPPDEEPSTTQHDLWQLPLSWVARYRAEMLGIALIIIPLVAWLLLALWSTTPSLQPTPLPTTSGAAARREPTDTRPEVQASPQVSSPTLKGLVESLVKTAPNGAPTLRELAAGGWPRVAGIDASLARIVQASGLSPEAPIPIAPLALRPPGTDTKEGIMRAVRLRAIEAIMLTAGIFDTDEAAVERIFVDAVQAEPTRYRPFAAMIASFCFAGRCQSSGKIE